MYSRFSVISHPRGAFGSSHCHLFYTLVADLLCVRSCHNESLMLIHFVKILSNRRNLVEPPLHSNNDISTQHIYCTFLNEFIQNLGIGWNFITFQSHGKLANYISMQKNHIHTYMKIHPFTRILYEMDFPSYMVRNAESVSMSWRHDVKHAYPPFWIKPCMTDETIYWQMTSPCK